MDNAEEMAFLALLPEHLREGISATLRESPSIDREEYDRLRIDGYNAMDGDLEGYDCPLCRNKGRIMYQAPDGEYRLKPCVCIEIRKSKAAMDRSGLQSLEAMTWESWQAQEPWQAAAVKIAQDYAAHPEGWFLASGRPGTGKTHLCTAICADLLSRGAEVKYLLWRDFSAKAKALIGDAEAYQGLVDPAKRARVLYVDDFLKCGKGAEPTAGDVNLAFEVLNARYAGRDKITIISSELTIRKMLELDEAVGSRIYERAKAHYLDLSNRKNWRLQ